MRLAKYQTSIEQGLMIDLQVMVYIFVHNGECKIISRAASALCFVIVYYVNLALLEEQCLAFQPNALIKSTLLKCRNTHPS